MQLRIRTFHTLIEHKLLKSEKEPEPPLRKVGAVAVIENPYAGRYVEDLRPLIQASGELGRELAKLAVQALSPYRAQSYGKAAIVGLAGEQEHANAVPPPSRSRCAKPWAAAKPGYHLSPNAGGRERRSMSRSPTRMRSTCARTTMA
jgi:hypothetical protein